MPTTPPAAPRPGARRVRRKRMPAVPAPPIRWQCFRRRCFRWSRRWSRRRFRPCRRSRRRTAAAGAGATGAAARGEGQVGLAGVERRLTRGSGLQLTEQAPETSPGGRRAGQGHAVRGQAAFEGTQRSAETARPAEPARRAQRGAGLAGVADGAAARGARGRGTCAGGAPARTRHAVLTQAVEVGARATRAGAAGGRGRGRGGRAARRHPQQQGAQRRPGYHDPAGTALQQAVQVTVHPRQGFLL